MDNDTMNYVSTLGLDAEGVEFLQCMPLDLRNVVLQGFDPSGTKDGNVRGRLLSYARGQWSRRLNLDPPTSAYVRTLPEQVQMTVICGFDPNAVLDGNVPSALVKYVDTLCEKFNLPIPGRPQTQPAAYSPPVLRAPPQLQIAAAPYQNGAAGAGDAATFVQQLGLDTEQGMHFMHLPEEIQAGVMLEFDPSGTKDGNVWGRLLAFSQRVARKTGARAEVISHLRLLQASYEAPPGVVSISAQGVLSSVRQFGTRWKLEEKHVAFLEALPPNVQNAVVATFDGNTKDGNAWGRLLPYCRVQWAKCHGIDRTVSDLLVGLPEEAQMAMLTTFDPSASLDSGDVSARLEPCLRTLRAQAGLGDPVGQHSGGGAAVVRTQYVGFTGSMVAATPRGAWDGSENPAVFEFLQRIGLDTSAADILLPLPPEILQSVMSGFDPSGTKDGNVLGRLQGYVRSWVRKRGAEQDYERNMRTRVDLR